jgi:hypothetical protein
VALRGASVPSPGPSPRRGTWLYTQAGELDPLWLFLALHLGLGVVLVVASLFHGKQAFLAALSYNAVSVLLLAIIKVPIDRARLLAPALPKAMGALGAATSPPFAGMDQDERGPDDRDVTWD